MTNDGRRDPTSRDHDDDATREGENQKRETGIEYGANEAEQTRERERAPFDKTDEIGELP